MAAVNYINNKDFLASIIGYKEEVRLALERGAPKPRVPEYCGECIAKIATRIATQPKYASYTYKDEMIGDGVENCFVYFDNFDPDRSSIVTFCQNVGKELVGKTLRGDDGFEGKVVTVKPSIVAEGAETVSIRHTNPWLRPKRLFNVMEEILVVEDGSTIVANQVKMPNPFSYYSQIINNAFVRRINTERKEQVTKGKILLEMPYDVYDLQQHDEGNTGVVETYLETMRNSGAFNDAVVKHEERRSKKAKRKAMVDEERSFIEHIVEELEHDEL